MLGHLVASGLQRLAVELGRFALALGRPEAAKTIGVSGFHPHELRHTAASLAIASRSAMALASSSFSGRVPRSTFCTVGCWKGRPRLASWAASSAWDKPAAEVVPMAV